MTIELEPIHDNFGAEVHGVDLTGPLVESSFAEVLDAFHRYGLLLFRGTELPPRQQVALARRFPNDGGPAPYQRYLHPDCPEITLLGNVAADGGSTPAYLNKIGIEWHTDGTSSQTPAVATLLYAVEAPAEGGETLFAGGYAAWEAQDDDVKRRTESLRVRYDFDQLLQRQAKLNGIALEVIREKWRARFVPVDYPLTRVHPITGRRALWVTWAEMDTIVGLSRDESLEFVLSLVERGTAPENVYAHRWRPDDLVVWDNRCMLHSTTPYTYENDRRLMYRIGLNGDRSPV